MKGDKGLKASGALAPARPAQDQVASRKNQISPRNNSNFSKDFNWTKFPQTNPGASGRVWVPVPRLPSRRGRKGMGRGSSGGCLLNRGRQRDHKAAAASRAAAWNRPLSKRVFGRKTRAAARPCLPDGPEPSCSSSVSAAPGWGPRGCVAQAASRGPAGRPEGSHRSHGSHGRACPAHRLQGATVSFELGPGPAEGATGSRCPQGAGVGRRRCPALLQASLSDTALFSARSGRAVGESRREGQRHAAVGGAA